MNNKQELVYIDFYRKHKIAPVRQDISNLKKHFAARRALYRSLGLLPAYFKDKALIEFGPGCGHNAIFINSLCPGRYVLVDANPTGLEATRSVLKEYSLGNDNYEVIESLIEEYRSDALFDVVFCENVIPYQLVPADFLKHVASFVKPGGVLVITCQDSVSMLSEILRAFIRLFVVHPEEDIDRKLEILRPIFLPHLASLNSMTRLVDDWILDQIIQPITGSWMSISEAVTALDPEFEIFGSSPKFLTDWRWYKTISENHGYNERAIDLANQFACNFLDYRFIHGPQSREVNDKIRSLCDSVFTLLKEFEKDQNTAHLQELVQDLDLLSKAVYTCSPQTASSIEDFARATEHYLRHKSFPELKEFVPFFGRGTQYLSFTRREDDI